MKSADKLMKSADKLFVELTSEEASMIGGGSNPLAKIGKAVGKRIARFMNSIF